MYKGLLSSRLFHLLKHFSSYDESRWQSFKAKTSHVKFPIPSVSEVQWVDKEDISKEPNHKELQVDYVSERRIVYEIREKDDLNWPTGLGMWMTHGSLADETSEIRETIDDYWEHLRSIKLLKIQEVLGD